MDLPDPGIELGYPALQAYFLPIEPRGKAYEYWSREPIPSPVDLPDPGTEPGFPALQVDSLPTDSYQGSPRMLECVAYPFSSGSS